MYNNSTHERQATSLGLQQFFENEHLSVYTGGFTPETWL